MTKLLTTTVAGVMLAATSIAPALAYPSSLQPAVAQPGDGTLLRIQYGGCFAGERPGDCRERLRWERRHNRQYEWRDGRYHERRRDNDAGAAIAGAVLGFALGAAIAGSQDDYRYYNAHRGDRRWRARCETRYRSFDWRTGTYLSSDGYRRYCRL